MSRPYGYLVGTKGADDEPVDAYVGPDKDAPDAYVVHQHKPDGTGFDEDKVMLGFQTKEEARKAYLEHYDSDKFLGPISRVPIERLQELVESKEKLTKISKAVSPEAHVYREQKGNCGPASLRIALRQHGLDVPEHVLAAAAGTDGGGARPEDMEEAAEAAGLKVDVEEPMSVGRLKSLTDDGRPVIVAYQAWKNGPGRWKEDQEDGHYSVVNRITEDGVELSDPSSKRELRTIPMAEFLERWHDVDKDGVKRDRLGLVVKHGSFDSELRKLAYGKEVHVQLMRNTIDEAFGKEMTPEGRRVMLDVARESDIGLRHPWNPLNAAIHAFPTSTKEEVRQELKVRHHDAVGSLARAIGDDKIGDTRREILATQGLLGLAQTQHSHLDIHSHIEKPLEIARAESPEKEQEFLRIRKAMRESVGSLGGFVTSGMEHVRSGLKWDPRVSLKPRSEVDMFDPDKYESDARSLETSQQYGKEIRKSLVGQLKSKYDMPHAKAEGEIDRFIGALKPGVVALTAAEALAAAGHVKGEAVRLWKGAIPGVMKSASAQPKGIKVLYLNTGGGHKSQANAIVEAAKKRGLPAEAINFGEAFGRGDHAQNYERSVSDYFKGKGSLLDLGASHAKFYALGTDHDKLKKFVDDNRDHAIVLAQEHLQLPFREIDHPVHVLHTDPVKWPLSSGSPWPGTAGPRIHVGMPEVIGELKPKDSIEISGLPVSQRVLHGKGAGMMAKGKFNVTVSGGNLGVEVLPLTKKVLSANIPEDAVVHAVAGTNEKLLKGLQRLAKKDPRVRPYGFAALPEMMREADLNVIRSHGTTWAETVAAGKPAVYYGPKASLMDYQGALTRDTAEAGGRIVGHPVAIGLEHVPDAVNEALVDPDKYQRLAVAAKKRMGDPAAQAVRGILLRKK